MLIKLKNDAAEKKNDKLGYEKLFKETTDYIGKDLNCSDYELIKEYNKGATSSIKKVVTFGNTKLFIKIGEKVTRENDVYNNQYFKNNKIFLNKIEKYCRKPNVLVLPFYAGKNLDEFLFDEKISINKKLETAQMILEKTLNYFWLQNVKLRQNNLRWFKDYLWGRFNVLKNSISVIEIDDSSINAKSFFGLPIEYTANNKTYLLPSIDVMHEKVTSLFDTYKPHFTSCATVDFQPPNILVGVDEFKHVDLSNGEIENDMAIDLGKFFNFINRFYGVSFLRDGLKEKTVKTKINIRENKLIVKADFDNQNLSSQAFNQLEENFCLQSAKRIKDFNLINRVKLYKFVINSITIKRHLNYNPLTDLLIANLIDSYAEVCDKIINI